ncbi:APC membrane recruitment protein 2-like [Conger conger]|uniref:APC membrane recruitment protein 2-like n=1 Tax=Conger conger TaxID=82655 RepID=UPI002A5AA691|nr:APC membrane recruitment protein 2-like [Conger conger]
MDLQSESDPQPSGKINKAAFKLFGKRKPGSPVSSIFSIRGKGEGGKGAAKAPLVRSNTHDGIMETPAELEGRKKEESTGGGQPCSANEAVPAVSPRTSFSSVTSLKSLGFLALLRPRGRAGEGEPRPAARRRRGLKGLFGSVRWHRKDPGAREEREEEPPPPPALLLASRSNSVEIVKEHMTLTPRPPPRAADAQPPPTPEPDEDVAMPVPMDDGSPLMEMAGDQWNKIFFPYSALGPKGRPAPTTTCSTEAGDEVNGTSSRTEDSRGEKEGTGRRGTGRAPDGDGVQGKVAEEKACPALASIPKVSDAAHPPGLKPTATSTKATVSMDTDEDTTGQDEVSREDTTCRNREEEEEFSRRENVLGRAATCAESGKELVKQDGVAGGASGPTIRGRKPSSHDEEDVKAQIQGLQRVALQREEGLPASPPSLQSGARWTERRPPPVKALGLSKIPVSGCARAGKQPREDGQSKDTQDIPPNYDEGYWDSPTPGLEEEGASFLAQEEEESPDTVATGDNTTTPVSTHDPKLTPSSLGSGRPLKGNSSLPRDSKIPVKQPVSHTVSHGTATSATTPTSHTHGTKAEATRTKIPVSKVPVRRTSARSAPLHDLPRK